MRAPWTNKTGLAKATAILATVLGISLGLCGVNYIAFVSHYDTLGNAAFQILVWAAWCETAAIVVSAAGLIVVGAMALWRLLRGGSDRQLGKEE